MNMKLLVGAIVVIVVIIVAVPLVGKLMAAQKGGEAPTKEGDAAAVPSEPPLLNSDNLLGSVWEVKVSGFPIQITLNPGGQAVAFSDNAIVKQMAGTDTLTGTWSVAGDKLSVSVDLKGKSQKVNLHISGMDVYYENKPVKRIK